MIDSDAAGPCEPFNVDCDMTNGGWTLIFSSNATPAMMRTVEPALPMTASLLPCANHARPRDGLAADPHPHRRTNRDPFGHQRAGQLRDPLASRGLTINSNSPLRAASDSTMGVWSGPMATTAANLWHGCGTAPFGASALPVMFWACNNTDGAHIGPTRTAWTSAGAEENIEIYVR